MEGNRLSDLFVFGMLEKYLATLCLVSYRITGKRTKYCDCRKHPLGYHFDHGVSHSIDVSDKDRSMIAFITQLDQELYLNARRWFFKSFDKMQSVLKLDLRCLLSHEPKT